MTIESFMKLPVDQRKTVAQFLPSMDQEGDESGNVTARKSAFSNVFFAAALREWQKSLRNSQLLAREGEGVTLMLTGCS